MSSTAAVPEQLQLICSARETPTLIACGPGAASDKRQALEDAGCQVLVCDSANRREMIESLLRHLGEQNMTNILLEGGSELLGSWFDADAIDELHVFLANKILGGNGAASPLAGQGLESIDAASSLAHLQSRPVETDLYLWGPLRKPAAQSDKEPA